MKKYEGKMKKYVEIMKKYAPLYIGRGTWKNYSEKFRALPDGSVTSLGVGREGTPEKRHETCQ